MKNRGNMRLFHMGCGESLGASRLTRNRWSQSWLLSFGKKEGDKPEPVKERRGTNSDSGDS